VAPTRFLEVDTSQIKKVKNTAQSDGLAAGRLVIPGSQRVVTTRAASGPVTATVLNRGFGLILQQLMGGAGTIVQQGATTAWLQTYPIADNVGKSMTFQNGIPSVGGTSNPYTFLGSKIMSAEFSCGVDELLKVTLQVDCQDVSESQGLAAPSYITGVMPFHFGQMNVKLGTFGAEAVVQGVRKMSIKIERPQETGRFYAGNAGLKSEPIMNGRVAITGSADVDFVTKADWADRFAADSSTSLVWEFIGPNIASTFYQTFLLRVPMMFLDGDGYTIDGQDIQKQTFPLVGAYDLTNPGVQAEYMSTDTVA